MALELHNHFKDFLQEIRPTPSQRADMAKGHKVLRERLLADEQLSPGIVGMFLQGSYKRSTAVRPKEGKRSDVDLIVVTRMEESEFTPAKAMACFKPFLEKYYPKKYRPQGRSFGIELSYVEMDLVLTAAPSEAQVGTYSSLSEVESELHLDEDDSQLLSKSASVPLWKAEPLRIPDRELGQWQDTDPLTQLRWTTQKNARCSGHFVNVVKAIKWWRLIHAEALPERPKSYPLEHLIGDCCPDGIMSVAEGVVKTLESFVLRYSLNASARQAPYARDRGVDQDVMARINGEDFAKFHAAVARAAQTARRAFDAPDLETAVPLWRELFGEKFPGLPGGTGGFTPHQGGSGRVRETRFALD